MIQDPHAESKKLYAQDALETDKPWERWELMPPNHQEWLGCYYKPRWWSSYAYRRRTTLNINGHEVPMPLYAKPGGILRVFRPNLIHPELAVHVWCMCVLTDAWQLGIYHLTAEAAVLHAKALLSFSERKKP